MQHQQVKKSDKSHDADAALNNVKREYVDNFDGQDAGIPLYLQPANLRSLQRQPIEEAEEEDQQLQTKSNRPGAGKASQYVTDYVNSVPGSGQPLPSPTKSFFESRFGQSFSNVRIHSDTKSAETAKSIQARAYTSGRNIVFGAGEYSPDTSSGKKLLAHELTHVIQQSGGSTNALAPKKLAHSKLNLNTTHAVFPKINQQAGGNISPLLQRTIIIRRGGRHTMTVTERRQLFAATPSTRDTQIILRNRDLANRIIDDMVATGDDLDFSDVYQLRSELIKRLTTSVVMTATQRGGSEWPSFGYPRRGRVRNYGPRVNYAARDYWEPEVPDGWDSRGYRIRRSPAPVAGDPPDSHYVFTLKPARRNQGYQALMNLFIRQPGERRRNRTLIHCDHLATLIHYRAYAAALGEREFNRRVSTLRNPANPAQGYIIPLTLSWNGFMDIGRRSPDQRSRHLQRYEPHDRNNLVIGDHVLFFNHLLYDFLLDLAGTSGNWRLENAILVDRREEQTRAGRVMQDYFLGHGSGRHTEQGMKLEMRQRFNQVVVAALAALRRNFSVLQARYPGVLHRIGGNYFIKGSAISPAGHSNPTVCSAVTPPITLPIHTNWRIHQLTTNELDEIPGLYDPNVYDIDSGRIVYRDPNRLLWYVRRPVESTP